MSACQITGVVGGVTLGLLLWLGPAAAIGFTGHLASDKHIGILGIDVSYQLVFSRMQGAILGGWR